MVHGLRPRYSWDCQHVVFLAAHTGSAEDPDQADHHKRVEEQYYGHEAKVKDLDVAGDSVGAALHMVAFGPILDLADEEDRLGEWYLYDHTLEGSEVAFEGSGYLPVYGSNPHYLQVEVVDLEQAG